MGENAGKQKEGAAKAELFHAEDDERRKNDAADADAGSGNADGRGKARIKMTRGAEKVGEFLDGYIPRHNQISQCNGFQRD